MVGPVNIDRATMEDLDAVTALWLDLVAGQRSFGSHLLTEANETPARDVLGRYIAADDLAVARTRRAIEGTDSEPLPPGTIVGFVMWHLERGLFEEDVQRGTVENVYVVPPARGNDIGSSLMDLAEDALREEGAAVVSVSAMVENEAAKSFYRQRGYDTHRVVLERSFEGSSTRTV